MLVHLRSQLELRVRHKRHFSTIFISRPPVTILHAKGVGRVQGPLNTPPSATAKRPPISRHVLSLFSMSSALVQSLDGVNACAEWLFT